MQNIFEKFSYPELTRIIGEDNLESIKEIIILLNDEKIHADDIYRKEFLALYVKNVLGSEFIKRKENFEKLLNFLNDDELLSILQKIGIQPASDRIQNISTLIDQSQRKTSQKVLGDYFNIDLSLTVKQDSEKDDDLLLSSALIPYKPLKDYQFEVLFKSLEKLTNPYSRFILQMPTGSGKTRTAMEIISQYLNNEENCSVIWLAHSVELCDQACACFLEVWPHLAKKQILFKRHYGSFSVKDSKYDEKINFLCGGFQSIYASIKKDSEVFNAKLYPKRLIVIDEAHKVIAETYQYVTKSFQTEGANFLGLTATPGRSYKTLNSDEENQKLADFFFEDIVTFRPDKNLNAIEYLRNKGVLATATLNILKIEATTELTEIELKKISESFDFPKEFLSKMGKNNIRNAEIINKIQTLLEERNLKSIIYFATSLEQSKLIASLLSFLKIKAVHVDGDTSPANREKMIQSFRLQEVQVLCNYEVLSTGFDAPLVDCVFIARPTASVVLFSQMIGRGLRGPAIGGKKECLIVNVRDNFINFPSIDNMYDVFEDYWN